MGKKVLIIDDDLGLTELFKRMLEENHYKVLLAQAGESGLLLAQKELPNLILLDYMLPDINGVEILKKLKNDEQTKNIPVVILTNFGQEEILKSSLNNGAAEIWLKYQVGPEDLTKKVGSLLSQVSQNPKQSN